MKNLFFYLKIIPDFFSYIDTSFKIPKNPFTYKKNSFLLWQCSIVIIMCCIFFYFCYQTHNELFYIIKENDSEKIVCYFSSIKNLITVSITLFGTLLALYWASIIGALSIQYASIPHVVKEFFFNLVKSKLTTLLTSCYLISNFFLYIAIDYNIISKYLPLVFYSWLTVTIVLICLYSWLAVEIFKYIDSYQLYHNLSQKNYINFYHIAYWHDKVFFKPSINKVHNSLSLQHNIITYGIYKEFLIPSETIKFLTDTLQLITLYWKKKKTIYYNCDWYFSVLRQNSLSEIIFTGNNSVLARDILQIETWLFELNNLIVNYLIENKNFFILSLYYGEIRKILSLEEKENLFTYNIPFFYETLNLILNKINRVNKLILTQKSFNYNKKDINLYGTVSTLNNVLGNIFMNNQKYLFKFEKANVNTVIPAYEKIIQSKNIQELLIKYPVINNEAGLKAYTKLFIERNTEHEIITSEEHFYHECNLSIIQMELSNILKLFKSIEEQLKENLTFFAEQRSPHYFFDTFFTFLSIKYEFLMNNKIYQDNYAEYFTNPTEKNIITSKVHLLFNYYQELPEQLTTIIKSYRDEKYFAQKEFPNVLNNIYELLLTLLIFYFNSNDISFQTERKNTIKITFHFMLTVQQTLTLELEELKKEEITIPADYDENFYVNYYSAFIQFAAIIGSGIQKIGKNLYDTNNAFSDILVADDIRTYFHLFVSKNFYSNIVSFHFYPLIQPIEQQMKSTNSLAYFLEFIQSKLKEHSNDK